MLSYAVTYTTLRWQCDNVVSVVNRCNTQVTFTLMPVIVMYDLLHASNTLVTLSLMPVLYDLLLHAYWWAMMMLPPTFWLYKMLVECSMVTFILVTRIFLLHFVHELIQIFWAHFFTFWIDSHFCNSVVWLVIYALLLHYSTNFWTYFFCRKVFALFLGFFIDGDGVTIVLIQMESK